MSGLLATVFGIGSVPWAPGTLASLVAVGVWCWWHPAPATQWLAAWAVTVVGVWAAGSAARRAGAHDPSSVVIDEWAGMWLALAGLPKDLPVVLSAFALFRLLDIAKWPPMRQLERLPGGWGIMLDDVAAGVIARAVLGAALAWLIR